MTIQLANYTTHSYVMVADTAMFANNVVATDQKISSFQALPSGWHYGEGYAPSSDMIANAHDWHRRLTEAGFVTTDAFPGVGGEIMITGYHGSDVTDIVLETDNSLSLYHERNDDPVRSLSHSASVIVSEELKKISGELWSTFGFSTNETLTLEKTASTAWRLRTMEVAAPSFNMIASCRLEHHYVPTYGNTIQRWRVNHRSSGFLMGTDFPLAGSSFSPRPRLGTRATTTSLESLTSNTRIS